VLAFAATFASGLRALRIVSIVPTSDEGIYFAYMKRLDARGLASFPELFDERTPIASVDSHETPYRVGHIALTWIAAKLSGPTFETLTYVSFACHVLLILAVWRLGRPLFGARFAAGLTLAMAGSPLLLRLAPQPLIDSPATLGAVLSVLTFLALLERPTRAKLLAFVAAFTFALSVKELAVLLVPPFLAIFALERRADRTSLRFGDLAVALLAPGILCYALWVLAAQDASAGLRYLWTGLRSTSSNEYVRLESSGPWHRYIVELFLLSPAPTLLAFAGLGWMLFDKARFPARRVLLPLAVLAAVTLLVAAPLPKNLRFFAIFELPLRAFEVATLFAFAQRLAPRRAALWTTASLALLGALDLYAANYTFVHLYDPLLSHLLHMRGLAP
jgi:4-amino-4-deoxy-L-arabinose transferase-like glycosyltransferase